MRPPTIRDCNCEDKGHPPTDYQTDVKYITHPNKAKKKPKQGGQGGAMRYRETAVGLEKDSGFGEERSLLKRRQGAVLRLRMLPVSLDNTPAAVDASLKAMLLK